MKYIYSKLSIALLLFSFLIIPVTAQNNDDNDIDNGVISSAGRQGFSFQTKNKKFLFKPYALIQIAGKFNYYDDEGLNLADQDKIANSGFAIPNAIIGFSGRAFGRLTFNFALNASQSGGALLQQAWFDVKMKEALQLRAGKFKTPYNQAYLVTLGETLFPVLPSSLTTGVNLDKSLNAVKPNIATGFDLGIELHGLIKQKWGYQVGVFNGTGIDVNTATKTTSDDHKGIPSLLYAARFAYMPFGPMLTYQGNPDDLHNNKLLFAISGNYNVEAEDESSDDLRAGFEFAWLKNRFYISGEVYMLRMNFTKRMQSAADFTAWGAYIQGGYFVTSKLQTALRYDFFDRNGTDKDGSLNMPAVGLNYFFSRCNLKLQAMYQYIGRWGHETQLDRDMDDNGMAMHSATVMLQYTF